MPAPTLPRDLGALLALVQQRRSTHHRQAVALMHSAASLPRPRPELGHGAPDKQKPPALAVAEGFTSRTPGYAGGTGGCCRHATTAAR